MARGHLVVRCKLLLLLLLMTSVARHIAAQLARLYRVMLVRTNLLVLV